MFTRTFTKAFAATVAICAAAGGVFAAGAAVLGGATVAAPVIVGAAAVGVLGSAGVMAAGHYVIVPVAQFFVELLSIFSGVRFTGGDAEKIRDENRGTAAGLGFSGIAGAIALASASVQGAYNTVAEREQPAVESPAFTCAADQRRVEQVVTAKDGSRVLQVSCQPR